VRFGACSFPPAAAVHARGPMTIRRAQANSNAIQINDLPVAPCAGAGDANRHLLH